MKTYDVIIVGAGTSGLTARREVAKKTQSYLVIDDGPLGTTCARVGCMPSKVLIQAANDFERRKSLATMGIQGGEALSLDGQKVLSHVRSLRDRFVKSVKGGMEEWQKTHLLRGRASFVNENTLEVDGEHYKAKKIILGLGSRPVFLKDWEPFKDHILTTDEIFELEDLPESVAVFGLGVIGVEIGQALSRLGVNVYGITMGKSIGGILDEEMQDYILEKMSKEFPIFTEGGQIKGVTEEGKLRIQVGESEVLVDKALAAIGRRTNLDRIQIEKAGVTLNSRGAPEYDKNTLKLVEQPHVFLPGDVNGERALLHEAADEGIIAGHNAVHETEDCFQRRAPLGITFTDPNIATVGLRGAEIEEDFVTGKVSFEGQGRSIVKLKEKGLLKVYVSKKTHKFLGAEIFAPDGEHLAHLVSWALSMNLSVFDMLKMPFYHPVIEEGLRTALRDAASQLNHSEKELLRCQENLFR